MKKIRILCICIILSGIGLFIISLCYIPAGKPSFEWWCIGFASALIILGLGNFINTFLQASDTRTDNRHKHRQEESHPYIKERSGYLVCKIMNLLLCIYLLIIYELGCQTIILLLGIALVLIQFLLDLLFQIILYRRRIKKQGFD